GALGEEVRGLDVAENGAATVVGFTRSTDFPVTPGVVRPLYSGSSPFLDVGDGFVVRFTPLGNALEAATYLGGVYDDVAESVVLGPQGDTVVAGWTSSNDFPIFTTVTNLPPLPFWQGTFGAFPAAQSNGFVTRLAANFQSYVFSRYVGSLFGEQLLAVDLDPATGDAVAVGWSIGTLFPTTPNVFSGQSNGGIDGVVIRLSPTGITQFATYVGGIDTDALTSVAVAANGIWIGGFTSSPNFPASPLAPQRVFGGAIDGVVAKLSATGQSMPFSTFLGGVGEDKVRGIDVAGDKVLVVGEAGVGFRVTADAAQSQFGGGNIDAFVTYFTNGGDTLEYSTYFGGVGPEALSCVTLISSGLAVVGGWSFSSDFPIGPPAFQSQLRGVEDGVVLKLDVIRDVGDGLEAQALATSSSLAFVDDGDHEVLAMTLKNRTDRELVIESVRVLVAGSGSAPQHVSSLRAYREEAQPVAGAPGASTGAATLVAGPLPVTSDDVEIDVPLSNFLLAPMASANLRIRGELRGSASGDSIEVACAVVDATAWTLIVPGAGAGPSVRVLADGRIEGPVLVLGALPGDADGDAERTVFDVRLQLAHIGTQDRAVDSDGDGVLTAADVQLTRDAVLGRATMVARPEFVQRGTWLTLRGVFPVERALQASLGGTSLVVGRATPREITVRIEATQPIGTQDLVVSLDGKVLLARSIAVQ
ncbi:MAG: hypothetical protein ABIP94_22655, partial [Planctomycetota bacterium]